MHLTYGGGIMSFSIHLFLLFMVVIKQADGQQDSVVS
jgi:hypothetical protein